VSFTCATRKVPLRPKVHVLNTLAWNLQAPMWCATLTRSARVVYQLTIRPARGSISPCPILASPSLMKLNMPLAESSVMRVSSSRCTTQSESLRALTPSSRQYSRFLAGTARPVLRRVRLGDDYLPDVYETMSGGCGFLWGFLSRLPPLIGGKKTLVERGS